MEPLILELPQEILAPASFQTFEGTYDLAVMKAGPDLYSFKEPVSWTAEISNTGDALLLQGEVEGNATTSCARCLGDVHLDLFGELEGYFLLDETAAADYEDEEFAILPEDRKIDLAPLIQAALLLDVPYVPLCSEDCKGLCPQCGADLNAGPCGCTAEEEVSAADNPFAVLKNFVVETEN